MTTGPDPQMSGTAEGLIVFLDWAGRTGQLGSNTAAAYKTAVTQVLEIDGEAWTATNIQGLDVEHQLDRFARLRASRYNPTSLRTYGNRFRAAVTHYRNYLEDPTTFRTNQPKGTRAKDSERPLPSGPGGASKGSERARRAGASSGVGGATEAADLVQYPFPLRTQVMAYLSLPRDLRRSEAQRIAAFVASLAIDSESDLGAGQQEGS
jgi:hypothetical protein